MVDRRTHVVHLTSVHSPLDTRVFWKECRTVARAGYRVSLVAPEEEVSDLDGVHFVPLPRPRSRVERALVTPWQVYRRAVASGGDLFHFHDPELLPVGALLRLRTRRPIVFDSHEDVPRLLASREWIPTFLRPAAAAGFRLLERAIVPLLSAVVSAEPGGAPRFPPAKTVVVQNFPLLEEFEQHVPWELRANDVVYVGDITRSRGAVEMIDAMALLPDDVDAKLVIAGRCNVPGLMDALAERPGWKRTSYIGWQSRGGIRNLLSMARVGLVVLHPTPQYEVSTQPVKLFEYLAAGVPVVASNFAAWRPLVEGAGLTVNPLDPAAIAEAIATLLTGGTGPAMAEHGRRVARESFSWQSEGERLTALYSDLLGAVPA